MPPRDGNYPDTGKAFPLRTKGSIIERKIEGNHQRVLAELQHLCTTTFLPGLSHAVSSRGIEVVLKRLVPKKKKRRPGGLGKIYRLSEVRGINVGFFLEGF